MLILGEPASFLGCGMISTGGGSGGRYMLDRLLAIMADTVDGCDESGLFKILSTSVCTWNEKNVCYESKLPITSKFNSDDD